MENSSSVAANAKNPNSNKARQICGLISFPDCSDGKRMSSYIDWSCWTLPGDGLLETTLIYRHVRRSFGNRRKRLPFGLQSVTIYLGEHRLKECEGLCSKNPPVKGNINSPVIFLAKLKKEQTQTNAPMMVTAPWGLMTIEKPASQERMRHCGPVLV